MISYGLFPASVRWNVMDSQPVVCNNGRDVDLNNMEKISKDKKQKLKNCDSVARNSSMINITHT